MIKRERIPNALFKKILKNVPRPTADLLVTVWQEGEKYFLLGKRGDKPYRGKWFIPGGSVFWGESPPAAATRQLKRELGIVTEVGEADFLFVYSFVFPPNNTGVRYHSLMHVYKIVIPDRTVVRPNKENTSIGWFSAIDPRWPKPLKDILRRAGFK